MERIIDKVKAKKTYLGKSEMCSGNKYLITITYNGNRASFHFHDNYKNDSNKRDFIEALFNDAIAYESHSTIDGFMFEFGYEEPSKAKRVYDACKKQYDRLFKLFNEEEQSRLLKELGWC